MHPSGQATHTDPLPSAIRQHLGQALALAYADRPAVEPSGSFQNLLARLETILDAQDGRRGLEFRAGLLNAANSLLSFVISLTRDRTRADDLVQNTMLRAWRSQASYTPGTNLDAWLFTILRNVFYSEKRKHHREVQDSEGIQAEKLSCVPEQGGAMDLQDVLRVLDSLPPTMRECLVLLTLHHMTYEEVANVMGCEIGTVKSRVWRARDLLKKKLGYGADEIGADAVSLAVLEGQRTTSSNY